MIVRYRRKWRRANSRHRIVLSDYWKGKKSNNASNIFLSPCWITDQYLAVTPDMRVNELSRNLSSNHNNNFIQVQSMAAAPLSHIFQRSFSSLRKWHILYFNGSYMFFFQTSSGLFHSTPEPSYSFLSSLSLLFSNFCLLKLLFIIDWSIGGVVYLLCKWYINPYNKRFLPQAIPRNNRPKKGWVEISKFNLESLLLTTIMFLM